MTKVVSIIPSAIEAALADLGASHGAVGQFVEAVRLAAFPVSPVLERWVEWRKTATDLHPIDVLSSIGLPIRAEAARRLSGATERACKVSGRDPQVEKIVENLAGLLTKGASGPYGRVRTLNVVAPVFEDMPDDRNPARLMQRYLEAIEGRYLSPPQRENPSAVVLSDAAFSLLRKIADLELDELGPTDDPGSDLLHTSAVRAQINLLLSQDSGWKLHLLSLRAFLAGEKEAQYSARDLLRLILAVHCATLGVVRPDFYEEMLQWLVCGFFDPSGALHGDSPENTQAIQAAFHWLLMASAEEPESVDGFRTACRVAGPPKEIESVFEENPAALQSLAAGRWGAETIHLVLLALPALENYLDYADEWHFEELSWGDDTVIEAAIERMTTLVEANKKPRLSFTDIECLHSQFEHRIRKHSSWLLEFAGLYEQYAWEGSLLVDNPSSAIGVSLDQNRSQRLAELAHQNGWPELSQAILGFFLMVDSLSRPKEKSVDWKSLSPTLEKARLGGVSPVLAYCIEYAYEVRRELCGEDALDVLCLNAFRPPDDRGTVTLPQDRTEWALRQIEVSLRARLGADCADSIGDRAWTTLVNTEREYRLLAQHIGSDLETSDSLVVMYAKVVEIALFDRLMPVFRSEVYMKAVEARRPPKPGLGQLLGLVKGLSNLPRAVQEMVEAAVGGLPNDKQLIGSIDKLIEARNHATHERVLTHGAAADMRGRLLDSNSGIIRGLVRAFSLRP